MDSEEVDVGPNDTRSITTEVPLLQHKSEPTNATTKTNASTKPKADAKKAEKWLSGIQSATSTAVQRQAVVSSAHSGVKSTGQSKTIDSIGDSGALSAAIEQATLHIDQILRDGETDNELGVELYLRKLAAYPLSKLSPNLYGEYSPSLYHHALIQEAANASKKVYQQSFLKKKVYAVSGDNKACFTDVTRIQGKDTLVVAVRGTACLADALLDVNYQPQIHKQLLDGKYLWHTGFLRVAEHMESKIAADIAAKRKSMPNISSILFTGHSLGGAISHILLAMSYSRYSQLSQVVKGLEINCITFGAPPVSTSCIELKADQHPMLKQGVFLSIINEGDPIVLAQESYINTLISIYVLSPQGFEKEYGKLDETPKQVYHVSGQCIVLRDEDPDNEENDLGSFKAYVIVNSLLESCLFGNPFMHMMDEYIRSLGSLKADGYGEKLE